MLATAIVHGVHWGESEEGVDFWNCVYLLCFTEWSHKDKVIAQKLGLPDSKPQSLDIIEYALRRRESTRIISGSNRWYRDFFSEFIASAPVYPARRKIMLPTRKETKT